MAIRCKSFDHPDDSEEYDGAGIAEGVEVGGVVVWRSTLKPGWSWVRNVQPRTGEKFCAVWHHEYVVSGRVLYRMQDGTQVEAGTGDFLVIEPGHAAEVLGDEDCVMVDW